MQENESIHSFFSRTMEVVTQMRTYGYAITDETVVEKILWSLTRKYEYIISAIEESKDPSNYSCSELLGSLLSHEE